MFVLTSLERFEASNEGVSMLTTYEYVAAWLRTKTDSERGASLVEYALLLALIAVICIVALQFLGDKASESFNSIGTSIDNPGPN
jgi:pilus assembly protein Flp/PilA